MGSGSQEDGVKGSERWSYGVRKMLGGQKESVRRSGVNESPRQQTVLVKTSCIVQSNISYIML